MRAVGQCQRKPLDFAYAFRSFIGYLEGTQKSAHTIKNYRSDLRSFQEFLESGLGRAPVALSKVTREDLEKFHSYLKARGFKTNTRRRKVLTVRKLLRYLTQRNKLTIDVGRKLPAPGKVERVPATLPADRLLASIRALPADNEIRARNRVLLWTLAETGCLVSEIGRIRFESWRSPGLGGASLALDGRTPREVPVSRALLEAALALRPAGAEESAYVFQGHNKFGSLGSPITSRGVELLVRTYAPRLELEELTPRTFRHSAVLKWFREGVSREEIQRRLGLRTPYAFRTYEPLFKTAVAESREGAGTT